MYWKQVQRLPSTCPHGLSGAVPGLNDRNTRKLRTRKSEVEAGKVQGRHRPHTLSPTSANTTPEGIFQIQRRRRKRREQIVLA